MHKNVFAIGKCLQKMYNTKGRKIAEKHGISVLEVALLNFLHNNPDADTAKDFSLFVHLSKSSISEAVDSLTKKGYLVGRQDEADRRCIHLEIQESAKDIVADALEMQEEFFELVLKGFSEEEAKTLDFLMDRVIDNIKEASEEF